MSATGILAAAVTEVATQLSALGLTPVTDPRQARPYTVFIELPVMDTFTYNVGQFRIPIKVLGVPPGNTNSTDYLITTVDAIMDSPIVIVDARPGFSTYGGQDLPHYEMTVAIAVNRN
jgi:hypothetical protein